MANTEDYLDSLLNSINNTNMSGKKSKSYSGSDPYDNASEAFRKFEREQEYKREQRKKREEEQRFLQEFEGELEQEDVDDFLRQFELELAEEEENEANESVNTPVSYTHLDVYKRQGNDQLRRQECSGRCKRKRTFRCSQQCHQAVFWDQL